jgi:hypothetical protein
VTTTRKTARQKLDHIHTAAHKAATVKPQNQVATVFKTVADKPNPAKWVVTTGPTTSPLRGISGLLDNLPLETFLKLTRLLLNSISSHPTGAARPLAFLKTVTLFVAEYGSTPYEEDVGKNLRWLAGMRRACWAKG